LDIFTCSIYQYGVKKMVQMPDTEQQVYWELVHELLNYPQGERQQLLAARPELVNEKLVETMLTVAQRRRAQDGAAAESTVELLVGLAQDIAAHLGLELGGDDTGAQLRFLMEVLQSIDDSDVNPQEVYPLLQQNLALLNAEMIARLNDWASKTWTEIDLLPNGTAERDVQESIAMTVGNFGDLMQQFPLGDKAVNMELSIACYTLALAVFTVEEDARTCGAIQNSLAVAYSNRIIGDKAQNLEIAIAGYTSALTIRTKQNFPLGWAATLNNRAIAYRNRIVGDKAQNLETAIAGYTSALTIRTKQNFPYDWAATQNNLANAYVDRIVGDKAQNLETAIAGYTSALTIRTKQDFPRDWAATQNNLANAYLNRIIGDQAQNLEMAITGYAAALEIYTQQDFPIDWAMIQDNLACAHTARTSNDQAQNPQMAVAQ
jgi:tetratricopeptide (TPR) repeat protein